MPRVVRVDQFLTEPEEYSWLIDGLLSDQGWTFLHGVAGLGKTTFAMQMCHALATGHDFLGRHCKQTKILYCQADSTPLEWKGILRRVVGQHSTVWTLIELADKCLASPGQVNAIKNLMVKVQPGYVVFDSLYNIAGENINSENIRLDIARLKQLCNAPFMVIHHPPHSDTGRGAGHHSLSGNCSNDWSLSQTQLRIVKGRLVGDKSIKLDRDENGLWVLHGSDRQDHDKNDVMYKDFID